MLIPSVHVNFSPPILDGTLSRDRPCVEGFRLFTGTILFYIKIDWLRNPFEQGAMFFS